ncbi:MAG: hypothetical protein NDI63_02455 [Pseudobdellovibrio sp.]|nr:hypothetical protein [Pseudobdellovibrio sp.]
MKLIFITTCITLSILAGCTKKELPSSKKEDAVVDVPTTVVNAPPLKTGPEAEKAYAKMLGANLKFLGSLEKEVLKLLLEGSSPEVNQFEVLSFGFDKFNGAKTGFLQGFGCQKIAVRAALKKYEIYSECTKPAKKLAEINEDLSNKNHLTIVFLTSNWKVILGNAAGINPERMCEVMLAENKVQSLDCKDTVFSPRFTGVDINLYELKIRKYLFNRNQANELMIEGGQYKDLIENKKIRMTVPMSGKISIIEKELKVKDDFADMQNKLLGLEEQKQEKKNEEEISGKQENITPHTAEPEYIDAQKGETSSGTVATGQGQSEGEGQAENQIGEQNGEIPPEQAPPGEAEPNSVPATPPPQQPYGR